MDGCRTSQRKLEECSFGPNGYGYIYIYKYYLHMYIHILYKNNLRTPSFITDRNHFKEHLWAFKKCLRYILSYVELVAIALESFVMFGCALCGVGVGVGVGVWVGGSHVRHKQHMKRQAAYNHKCTSGTVMVSATCALYLLHKDTLCICRRCTLWLPQIHSN